MDKFRHYFFLGPDRVVIHKIRSKGKINHSHCTKPGAVLRTRSGLQAYYLLEGDGCLEKLYKVTRAQSIRQFIMEAMLRGILVLKYDVLVTSIYYPSITL